MPKRLGLKISVQIPDTEIDLVETTNFASKMFSEITANAALGPTIQCGRTRNILTKGEDPLIRNEGLGKIWMMVLGALPMIQRKTGEADTGVIMKKNLEVIPVDKVKNAMLGVCVSMKYTSFTSRYQWC